MFFSKPISELTYDDVVTFASQKIKEGVNLDYKRDFTADIEKTISAFANTYGGVLIIGIDDEDGRPKLPVTGIEYKEGLHERVVQKCVEAIHPPLFPEIKVCESVSGKTFVVIQVSESDQTPHAIANRAKVYYRTDNITMLEDRANVDRIQWLLNHREKSIDLRKMLIQDASKHFHDIWLYDVHKGGGVVAAVKVPPCLTFTIVPTYPHKPLATPQDIKNQIGDWHTRNKKDYAFPRYSDATCNPVQGGVKLFFYREKTGYFFYEEINQFGLLYSKEDLIRTVGENDQYWEPGSYLYEDSILGRLHVFLKGAKAFYDKYKYAGLLRFEIDFFRLENIQYIPYHQNNLYSAKIVGTPNGLQYDLTLKDITEGDGLSKTIVDILRDSAWSFGCESNEGIIQKRIGEL